MISAATQALNALYGASLLRALPTASQTVVGPLLNGLLQGLVPGKAATCAVEHPPPGVRREPTLVDFGENFVVNMTDFFINLITGADPDSDTGINTIIRKVAEAQGHADGVFRWAGPYVLVVDKPLRTTPQDLDVGKLTATAANATVTLGSFTALQLVKPALRCSRTAAAQRSAECYTLLSEVTNNKTTSWPVAIEVDVRVQLSGTGHIDDHFRLKLGFDAMDIDLDLLAKVDGPLLKAITVADAASPQCLLSTVAPQGLQILRSRALIEHAAWASTATRAPAPRCASGARGSAAARRGATSPG